MINIPWVYWLRGHQDRGKPWLLGLLSTGETEATMMEIQRLIKEGGSPCWSTASVTGGFQPRACHVGTVRHQLWPSTQMDWTSSLSGFSYLQSGDRFFCRCLIWKTCDFGDFPLRCSPTGGHPRHPCYQRVNPLNPCQGSTISWRASNTSSSGSQKSCRAGASDNDQVVSVQQNKPNQLGKSAEVESCKCFSYRNMILVQKHPIYHLE